MNEVVKYNNYMNGLRFTGFTATDFNFLMLLCSKLRDVGTSEVTISFAEIREKTGYTRTALKQFVSDLKRMNRKLIRITCDVETDNGSIMFVLFTVFETNYVNQTLIVVVNEKFKFILNELLKNFTRFDLDEFVRLDSKYSKNLYRLLKQYRITGRYEVNLEEFRNKMDVPEAYTSKRIMDNIINPALKELKENDYFKNLKCIVQYAHKKGRPVTGYIFTFDSEERIHNEKQKKLEKIINSRFNNINSRSYDYNELERQLLNKS